MAGLARSGGASCAGLPALGADAASAAPVGRQRQAGVAALALTMLLFFAMVLGVAFVNRNLIFEQRASANQYRSTRAFEAAEAGLEWALAQLNSGLRIGPDCLPSSAGAATSFRQRYLRYDLPQGRLLAATWFDSGVPMPLQPTCVLDAAGWRCSCPTSSPPVLATPPGSPAAAPAFMVQLQTMPRPGIVRMVAVGCTSLGGPCGAGPGSRVDSSVRIQALFALMPALRTRPAAAITARGSVGSGSATFAAHNLDAGFGGLAIHSGGPAQGARIVGPPGASRATTVASGDASLADLHRKRFFATYFGLDARSWTAQPTVRSIRCMDDCTAILASAVDEIAGSALLHVEGDLALHGPLTLGTADSPVVLVASGTVRLVGDVQLTGVLYGGSVAWNDTPSGAAAMLRGALLSESDFGGNGGEDIFYDAAVLARLQGNAGTFTRIAGSWRDF